MGEKFDKLISDNHRCFLWGAISVFSVTFVLGIILIAEANFSPYSSGLLGCVNSDGTAESLPIVDSSNLILYARLVGVLMVMETILFTLTYIDFPKQAENVITIFHIAILFSSFVSALFLMNYVSTMQSNLNSRDLVSGAYCFQEAELFSQLAFGISVEYIAWMLVILFYHWFYAKEFFTAISEMCGGCLHKMKDVHSTSNDDKMNFSDINKDKEVSDRFLNK